MALSGTMALGQVNHDNASVDELVEAIGRLHEKAKAGDAISSYELWRSGRIIDKVEALRKYYPVETRLKFLNYAAEKGNADACLALFEFLSCEKKQPFDETRKWLETSHKNGNNKASVILSLILGIDRKSPQEAINVITIAEERIVEKPLIKDEFTSKKFSRDEFKQLKQAFKRNDIDLLNKTMETADGDFRDSIDTWRECNRRSSED